MNEKLILLRCRNCRGAMRPDQGAGSYICEYCGSKIAKADVLKSGAYNRKYIMGVGAKNIPYDAIPFSVSIENAARYRMNLIESDIRLSDIAALKSYV